MADRAVITTLFNADISQLKGGMQQAESGAKNLKSGFDELGKKIAAAFTVGAVIQFGRSIVSTAQQLQDQADTLNVTTDALQAFEKVARENGASQEKLSAALNKVQSSQMELLGGTKAAVDAYEKLGIAAKDVEGLGTDEVFALIGDKVVNAADQTEAFQAVTDILGVKLAGNLLPTLKAVGNEGLQTVIDKAKEAGEVIDAAGIAKIDMLGDKWESFVKRSKVFTIDFVTAFKSGLDSIAEFWGSVLAGEGMDVAAAKSKKVIDDNAAAYAKTVDDAVAAQKAGNEQILQSNQETSDAAISNIDAEERRRKAEIDARIREEERAADEITRLQNSLADKQRKAYLDSLDAEGRLAYLKGQLIDLEHQRIGLVAQHGEGSKEVLEIDHQIFDAQTEINEAMAGQAELADDVAETWRDLNSEQADTLIKLRDALADMSEEDIDKFLAKLSFLADKLTKDPALQGKLPPMLTELGKFLESITGFKLPSMTSGQMGQMGIGGALSAFIQALKISPEDMAVIQQLAALGLDKILGPISNFRVPNFPPRMGAQLGRAIAELISGIGPLPAGGLDLSFLNQLSEFKLPKNFNENDASKFAASIKKIVEAFSGANAGAITALAELFEKAGPGGTLKILVEGGEDLPTSIPITWPSDSIDLTNSGLATESTLSGIKSAIDNMKGVIWK